MKLVLAAISMAILVGCSDESPSAPEATATALVLEGVVVADDVPRSDAVVEYMLGRAKPGDEPGSCDTGGWLVETSGDFVTDASGRFSGTVFHRDDGGAEGTVALEACLLIFTSPEGNEISSPEHFPEVHAVWGRTDTVTVTLDVSHLLD